ncbi:MAG: VWA domain-containing protein [Candidatus Hydrogenedentes bacterium]|nr:VWA domain-containing protein [Candidatus Hydrogenedentota bacterium]
MIAFTHDTQTLVLFAAYSAIVLACLAWILARLESRRARRLHAFAEAPLLSRLVRGYHPALRLPLNALILAGAALLLAALAGPRWGAPAAGPSAASREILVLLDTSESMNAADIAPSRLARARDKIQMLLERYPADRFGLIAFSGAAALECPLTRDHAYFRAVLESVGTDTLTVEGTDIESALAEAEKVFEDGLGRGYGTVPGDRIVLLISDGEAVSGDAVPAAERLADYARVAVLGVGDPAGAEVSLPQWMQRTQPAHRHGSTHWSVLDEEGLSRIAIAGQGVYVRSTLGNDDINAIGRELARLGGPGGPDSAPHRQPNQYRWPLAAALICFAGEGGWLVLMPRLAHRVSARRTREEADHALA